MANAASAIGRSHLRGEKDKPGLEAAVKRAERSSIAGEMRDARLARPAGSDNATPESALLDALIDRMGGGSRSIARGDYVNLRV